MSSVFVTRKIPDAGILLLKEAGHRVVVSELARPLTKDELITALSREPYDAVLSQLTDVIDEAVIAAAPSVKIFANYAIGFNNFSIEAAKAKGVYLTNTVGGGAERVAEFTLSLLLALACKLTQADRFVRSGIYTGFDPMLFHGVELSGKTFGIIGTGKIGAEVVRRATRGFLMKVVYFDVQRNESLEQEYGAVYVPTVDALLPVADFVSIHVPLLPTTKHLIDQRRLSLMKREALLINTSRGAVIDEVALVHALRSGVISGAGLDVFEHEPQLTEGLSVLENVIITPHIASSTTASRVSMSISAAQNIIAVLMGKPPISPVYT